MNRTALVLLLASIAISTTVFPGLAQTAGNPGAGTGAPPAAGAGNGNTRSPGMINPGNRQDNLPTPDTTSMPVFLSGKVSMADGSPVPQGVVIKRMCGTDQRTVSYTDSKGRFNFQLGGGRASSVIADASEPSFGADPRDMNSRTDGMNSGRQTSGRATGIRSDMMGCELRADAAGFTSSVIMLDGRTSLDNPEVGTIVLRRLANVEGTSISVTSLTAPSDAKKAYEKGLQSLHKGKPEEARKDLEKAVAIYPKYAMAWLDLGRASLQQNAPEPAIKAFQKALEAEPKLVDADVELGMLAARQSNWTDAARYLDAAIALDPVDFPRIWFPDAVANYNIKNMDAAEKSAREAVKRDPAHANPKEDQLLGLILATKQNYVDAIVELNTYIKLAPDAADLEQTKTQLAQIEALQAAAAH